MDKYTVDLDKVLNDFEYSELTEQSNGFSAAAAAAAAAVTQPNSGPNHAYTKVTYSYESTPAPPSYSKVSANSSAKHTINNVFHSLNEYLNSDIRTDFSEHPSAAPAAAAAASGSSSLANINEIEADAPSLVVRKTSADHAVAKIQDLFKTIPKEDENNAVIGGDSAGAVGAGLADVKTINNNINSELNLNRVKASNVPLDDETLSVKVENTSVNQRERNNIGKGRSSSSSSSHAQNLEKHNNTTSLHTVVNTEDASLNPEQSNNTDVNSHAGHVETINNNIAVVEQFEKTNADTANGDETSLAVRSIGETVPQPPGDTNKQLITVARETALLDKQVVETNDIETKVVQTKIVDTKHLETKDVETKHVETKVDETKDVEINVVKTKEVETKGVETIVVETKIVETKDVETKDTETKGTETKDVETTVVETKDAETTVVETKDAETTVVDDVSAVQPIGFEDVDISDSEMESALAELEHEYNHQQVGNNLLENADEFSEEKDLQTELEEVTGVKLLASTDSTVMLATNETEPTSETCAANVVTINENTQQQHQHHHQLAAEVHGEPPASAEDDFRAIADRMMKTKELIAKRYETNQIGEENRPNQRTDEFTAFMNKIQETEDRNRQTMNKTQRCEAESEEKVEENADDTQLMRQSNEICENAPRKSDNCNAAITIEAPDGSVTVENTTDAGATQPERNSAGTSVDTPAITVQTDEASAARRNSTLLRPNSLDLAGEQLTIDLIGEPGSTPYNNVYVESTLKPSTVVPEADTSLSPTLSDASTYENTDSPNTSDSCNDTSFDEPAGDKSAVATSAEGAEPAGAAVAEPGTAVQGPLLGKTAPFWTPDSDTLCCLHCNQKFTVLRRRHHCRACGLVLCAKCSNMKYKLEYMDNLESRVCLKCYDILSQEATAVAAAAAAAASSSSGSEHSPVHSAPGTLNPNNPMDYCSTVPPHQQVGNVPNQPPTVMVPVGVLKRKGSGKSRSSKSVMFCDGIRPGCDLTELDRDFNYKDQQQQLLLAESSSAKRASNNLNATTGRANRNLPKVDTKTLSYIPAEDNSLPPIVNVLKSDTFYAECSNNGTVVEMLKQETITFALQRNLHVQVRIINMDCCINKHAWCFTTDGMIAVGQDEIVVLLEFIDNEKIVPKDVFLHLSHIYQDAVKGTSISELGLSVHPSSNFLDSKNHVGLLFVKPTFQCIQNVILPKEPYLVGILIHRWETPWAKIFPLRLLLRLGAEYRYYPSPIISTRHRESVYVEIGHTIINLLADFRNFSYTIPSVRGLTIHMEEKNTTVSIPINRYDQVIKALNNSSDHILAFAANFSSKADSHLVCIQDTHGNNENAYTTHAINIHNKPRKVTGASFIVLNGALKSSSGLTAKSSIIEDGLMIQILPDQMVKLRTSLRNMKDFKIQCGCVNAQSDESVSILWTENDTNFNVGVTSPIDNTTMAGVPSIRVHNGKDYVCNSGNKMIRWTEVFIVQSGEENARTQDPVDISKVSESISKATCQALVKYLDLLATNSFTKIGIRTTLHVENVSYLAGSNGTKLPPIYMKSLDNELVPALHKITSNNFGEQAVILELVFHILNM